MSDTNESLDDALDAPPPEHSARTEGRIRAVEGILRTQQLREELQSGSRAMRQLRGELLPHRERPEPIVTAEPISERHTAAQPQTIPSSNASLPVARPTPLRFMQSPAFQHAITWAGGVAASVLVGFLSLWMTASTDATSERLTIIDVQGEALVEMATGTRKAQPCSWLFPGQRVVVKPGGSVRLRFDDDTLLELPGDSMLSLETSRSGKSVKLGKGLCRFIVKPQPAGEALTINTPNASVDVIGTTLAVSSSGAETEVDVESGKVNLARSGDGSEVQINAGYSAVAATGRDLAARKISFVLGVNLGGRSVNIDGNRWLSYREAISAGLSHDQLSVWDHPNFKLRQPEDPDLTAMLQSGVWTNESHNDAPLVLRQVVPNGEYKLYIWSTENAHSYMRRLTLTINGTRAATGIACVPYGEWAKCGPYTAHVTNGVLEFEIGRLNGNGGERHINGYALYKVGE